LLLFCSVLLAFNCRPYFLSFAFHCLVSYLFPVLWLQNISYVVVLLLIKSTFVAQKKNITSIFHEYSAKKSNKQYIPRVLIWLLWLSVKWISLNFSNFIYFISFVH
jgi:hypothetical protein